jgi:hypothetical protein
MDHQEKELWIMKYRCKTDDAICLLINAKKQRVAEYDERLREFREFMEVLRIKSIDQQLELFDPGILLTPKLEAKLDAPTQGLT